MKSAAPNARVYAVGYPGLIPPVVNEDCFIQQAAIEPLRLGLTKLNTAMQQAAKEAQVEFVSTNNAIKGHELCSAEPWVNGLNLGNPNASLHPTAEGQAAVATAVVSAIKS